MQRKGTRQTCGGAGAHPSAADGAAVAPVELAPVVEAGCFLNLLPITSWTGSDGSASGREGLSHGRRVRQLSED